MEKHETAPHRFASLAELHRVLGLPKPLHPLISLVENKANGIPVANMPSSFVFPFYKISLMERLSGRLKYGQGHYDFTDGGMMFKAPGQVSAAADSGDDHSGFVLLFHPDFLAGYPLAKKIKGYSFFTYSVNEALHLSEKEAAPVITVFNAIYEELQARIDDFSQDVIISLIETLLAYSNRFYKRQFVTRKAASSNLLERLEAILDNCFRNDKPQTNGIPTVHFLAESLNVSPGYLSDMLRSLTGLNAQQHIHEKLMEKAKERLSTTSLTVSEIAYELGFEHPSSFNKLFKLKTNLSPSAFRQSFN